MTSALTLWLRRFVLPERSAPTAWTRFVDAALRTPYYSARWRRAAVEKVRHPQGLSRIPPVELADLYRNPEQFRNSGAPETPPQPLGVPWQPLPRTLAVLPWFPFEPGVAVVMDPHCAALEEHRPQALAAPVDVLRGIARAALERRLSLPSLDYGLVALMGCSRPLLNEADRDLIWRAFPVPIYAQFRGFNGELLATDCECHNGLHIETGNALWEVRRDGLPELLVTSLTNFRHPTFRLSTGFTGAIDESPCPCGRPEPRLTGLALRPGTVILRCSAAAEQR